MILTLGEESVDIGCAQYSYPVDRELVQAKERSASGITYTEDFSVEIGTRTYNFINMDHEDYVTLMSFFVNTAVGMMYKFYLTDDLGEQFLVRFTQPKLPFRLTSYRLWAGSFTVETDQ